MVLLKNFRNIFYIAELRKKLFITLGILIVERLGVYVPVVGVNVARLGEHMKLAASSGGLLGYLDIFSGGAFSKATLFALGIGPYITSSIMMQFLGMSVPYFEQLMKEGEYGRKIINQYTRYLTVALSVVYSFGYATWLERSGFALTPGIAFKLLFVLSLTAGAVFVMWLAEQISLFGLGNGSSVIIFAGIVSRFPSYANKMYAYIASGTMEPWVAVVIIGIFLGLAACIVFLEKGERKIPVQYARRVVGQRVYGGQSTYIPFKINTAGVMPVILSSALLQMPITLVTVFSEKYYFFRQLAEWMSPTGVLFNTLEFLLIIFFSFVYTALIFNPEEIADNIKKSGGFILNIRPGKKTAEYFNYILTRIGIVGAVYLGLLAVIPNIMIAFFQMPFYLSGTSLLIVVSVALELSAQIESYLIEHRYEGFLTSGRLKDRVVRT